MKKVLTGSVLSLLCLMLGSSVASASWWTDWCCNRGGPKIKCRQYNAFSPYCCNPLPCGYHWNKPAEDCCDSGCVTGSVEIGTTTEPAKTGEGEKKSSDAGLLRTQPQANLPGYLPQQQHPFNAQGSVLGQPPFYPGFQQAPNQGYWRNNAPTGGR